MATELLSYTADIHFSTSGIQSIFYLSHFGTAPLEWDNGHKRGRTVMPCPTLPPIYSFCDLGDYKEEDFARYHFFLFLLAEIQSDLCSGNTPLAEIGPIPSLLIRLYLSFEIFSTLIPNYSKLFSNRLKDRMQTKPPISAVSLITLYSQRTLSKY